MEGVCPVCNGLSVPENFCDKCGCWMDNVGKLEDYFDPYSLNMGEEYYNQKNEIMVIGDQQCVHIFECTRCGKTIYKPFFLEFI